MFILIGSSPFTSEFESVSAPLMIGRTDRCKVRFNDTSLSRHQCIIDCIDDKWLIRDGDGDKGSTNGTWLFAEEEIKVEAETIIKAGLSLFKVEITE
jgi:pSer/pThr/pTyr-binding forkhead associated (FHA) protein